MRNSTKIMMMLVGLLMLGAGPFGMVFAQSIRPLTDEEKANLGATHEVRVQHSDLTTTTTNTAQTLTVAVGAKRSVELVSMMLVKAFDTENTNYTGSLAVTVGDGNDTDRYLTSTELASDGSEVFLKLGRSDWLTQSTFTLTNVVGSATNTYTVVSNVTISAAATLYTAADTIDLTFTPNAEEAVSANTSGDVRFYLRIFDAAATR